MKTAERYLVENDYDIERMFHLQGVVSAMEGFRDEHDNEIKQLINEMIEIYKEKQQQGVDYPRTVTSLEMIGWHNKVEALTELKLRI